MRSIVKSVAVAVVVLSALFSAVTAQDRPSFRDDRRLPPQTAAEPASVDPAIELRRQAESEARRSRDEEQKRLADLEARRTREEAERRAAEAETRRAAAIEARRRSEIESVQQAATTARRAAEEAEARRRADEDAQRVAHAEAQRRQAEAARRIADQEAKRRADDEAVRRATLDARRKSDEAERRAALEVVRRDEEAQRRRAEAEAHARLEQETRLGVEADALKQHETQLRSRLAADTIRLTEAATARAAALLAAKAADEELRKHAARVFTGTTDHARLLERARHFLTAGDIASARLLLERAVDAGSPDAARDLAATYTAAALTGLGLRASDVDSAQVARWSRRADELRGQAEAEVQRAKIAAAARRSAERVAAAIAAQGSPDVTTDAKPSRPPSAPLLVSRPASTAVTAGTASTSSVDRSGDGPRLLARGRAYLQRGDLMSSRLLFERAADVGSADAARELSRSHDANQLGWGGVPVATADPALVERWSRRAAELQAVADAQRPDAQNRNTTTVTDPERLRSSQQTGTSRASSTAVSASLPVLTARDVAAPVSLVVPSRTALGASTPRPVRDVDRYLSRGLAALESGDVNAARAFLERAVDIGSADAAIALARTYDPVALQTMTAVAGVIADTAEARRWYQRAQSLGATGLSEALDRLPRP